MNLFVILMKKKGQLIGEKNRLDQISMLNCVLTSIWRTAWVLGSTICKLVPYLQGVSVCASVYTLVAVAVERYRSISSPWRRRLSSRCCRTIIGLIWTGAAIITLPWLVVFRQDYDSDILVCSLQS